MTTITLDNISKQYGTHQIFNQLNLTIAAGEFLILTGPSGGGKSTLLNMIGGLEKPDNGEILFDGQTIKDTRKSWLKIRQQKINYIFQNFALINDLSIEKNLLMATTKANKAAIDEAVAKVGLAGRNQEIVGTLSGGEQQRVAIARAMVKKGDIILADEPTGSLDEANKQQVMSLLKFLNDQGNTIIMVTHDQTLVSLGSRHLDLKDL
jgi:putative ABC transport system ATP-binding protein